MDVDELQRADLEETDQPTLTLRAIGGDSVGRWSLAGLSANHRREVVETGTPRVQYFGLKLTGAIRDAFLQAQLR